MDLVSLTIENILPQEEIQTLELTDSKEETLYWESDDTNPNQVIYDLENNKTINEIVNEKFNGINYHFSNFISDPQISAAAKQNNLLIGSWTVNQVEDLNKLIAQGVEYITTNLPAQFSALVSKK